MAEDNPDWNEEEAQLVADNRASSANDQELRETIPEGNRASRYELIKDFGNNTEYVSVSPFWALAILRLAKPQSYSRITKKSIGKVVEGAFERKGGFLVISDDCTHLSIQNSKRSHTKNLTATFKGGNVNYLDADVLLGGDWVLAFICNSQEDLDRVLKKLKEGKPVNEFNDGLKFVGRAHGVRRRVSVDAPGMKTLNYQFQAIGFEELDNPFFYDIGIATSAQQTDAVAFMAQIGYDVNELFKSVQVGNLKDNCADLMETMINIILGRGVHDVIGSKDFEQIAPQQTTQEAPYAYLVPNSIGLALGRDRSDASKSGIFGYADILETLIGVQEYKTEKNSFYPVIDPVSTKSRVRCKETLKGTFIPIFPSFINVPLIQMLQQHLNPVINELYTSLRVSHSGRIMPMIIARQIPFSTDSIIDDPSFPLTKFLSLPRWVASPVLIDDIDIGRSNATRVNMVHVYGDAMAFAKNENITSQIARNPPIFDSVDIQRSGMRPIMKTVNCSLGDQSREGGARVWMEAIADWSIGSQYTLNGTVSLAGIQAPICEGDNFEFEGIAYHIETVTHSCSISSDGVKSFKTHLSLTNGMPVDQAEATLDFPRYPGFHNLDVVKKDVAVTVGEFSTTDGEGSSLTDEEIEQNWGSANRTTTITTSFSTDTTGDPDVGTSNDPGITVGRK